MAIGETSRERVKKAVERAFNRTWSGMKPETTASEQRAVRGPAQVEADLKDMVEAIVRGVGAGVANLDAETKQVDLVFGLKLKAGLSDAFSMLADLDRYTNVRIKVTLEHPNGRMHPAAAEDRVARTAETLPTAVGNGSTSAPGNGGSEGPSSGAAEDTASAS
jgi:hypothetical protein